MKKCDRCGMEIKQLRKPYFSKKLKCTWCGFVIDTWDMTLRDYWYDFCKLIGVCG